MSTIFLGLDHQHLRYLYPNLPPLLFETMVFIDATLDISSLEIQERCSSWTQAEEQHKRVVEQVREPGDEVIDLLEVAAREELEAICDNLRKVAAQKDPE